MVDFFTKPTTKYTKWNTPKYKESNNERIVRFHIWYDTNTMIELLQNIGLFIFLYMTLFFVVSLILKDASIVDIAWGIGFILAITMFFIVVVNNILGPINLFICLAGLILLFFETAFGICIGCIVYNLFNKERAKLCPGGICEIKKKEPIQKINFAQIVIVILFILSLVSISYLGVMDQNIAHNANPNFESNDQNITDCRVPDWAISMGHEKEYKLHHGCE